MCMDGDLIGGVMRGVMRGVVGYLLPKRDQVLKKPDLLSRCATGPEGGATLHRLLRREVLPLRSERRLNLPRHPLSGGAEIAVAADPTEERLRSITG